MEYNKLINQWMINYFIIIWWLINFVRHLINFGICLSIIITQNKIVKIVFLGIAPTQHKTFTRNGLHLSYHMSSFLEETKTSQHSTQLSRINKVKLFYSQESLPHWSYHYQKKVKTPSLLDRVGPTMKKDTHDQLPSNTLHVRSD